MKTDDDEYIQKGVAGCRWVNSEEELPDLAKGVDWDIAIDGECVLPEIQRIDAAGSLLGDRQARMHVERAAVAGDEDALAVIEEIGRSYLAFAKEARKATSGE